MTIALAKIYGDFVPAVMRVNQIFTRLACSDLQNLLVSVFECWCRFYPDGLTVIANSKNIEWFEHETMLRALRFGDCSELNTGLYVWCRTQAVLILALFSSFRAPS
jgi:hypothetical protein